jgi:hypothetical protein
MRARRWSPEVMMDAAARQKRPSLQGKRDLGKRVCAAAAFVMLSGCKAKET